MVIFSAVVAFKCIYSTLTSCTIRTYIMKQTFTCVKFEIPSKKQIESSMLDLPLPFKPVIALNWGSNPAMVVRVAYDLKPSITTCLMYIFTKKRNYKTLKEKHQFIDGARPLVLRAETFPEALATARCIRTQPTRIIQQKTGKERKLVKNREMGYSITRFSISPLLVGLR